MDNNPSYTPYNVRNNIFYDATWGLAVQIIRKHLAECVFLAVESKDVLRWSQRGQKAGKAGGKGSKRRTLERKGGKRRERPVKKIANV